MRHPIPREALDDRLGFIGTSGSGKTYNAGTAVEILLANHKARVVIIDPLGVWWGLRLTADGKKPSGFDVVIFGGDHADLPLNEQAGALIGETAAGMAESCIIDLSKLPSRAAERRFMVAFLETIYRKAGGEPFHLVVDEADLFAPQKPHAGDEVLLGHMENIVRRGRVRGFIPWLISQRPAVLNKNVLSQVDGLLAFKLTSVQDRDALDAWIEGQADKEQGKEIKASLPTFKVGEGIVWLPGLGILDRRSFPQKVTFDSSRKPKRGEKLGRRTLPALDVDKLKDRLAAVVQEAKANDPKALRERIGVLERDNRKLEQERDAARTVRPPAAELVEAERIGFEKGKAAVITEAKRVGQETIVSALEDLKKLASPLVEAINAGIKTAKIAFPDVSDRVKFQSGPQTVKQTTVDAPKRGPVASPVSRAPSSAPAGGDGSISGPEQKIIDAIRWWNVMRIAAPSHAQTAFIAGYSHKSGSWATYLSRLRSKGLIEGRGDLVLTGDGAAVAREPEATPSIEALHQAVLGKIDGPMQRILAPLLEAYPNGLSHAEAAEKAGYSHSSGSWATYLSRLRSLDLITGRGELQAQTWLFAS
ncbi:ATP-binding protein [Bradyrhizobium japonicum]|uniref:ATP-binding protein n=1 Tax=Bradyrhizobium japonicum TaxID=375 RepID=UPI0003FC2B97|nr:ATP-binding protein [Bradyrhizobium japonicum]